MMYPMKRFLPIVKHISSRSRRCVRTMTTDISGNLIKAQYSSHIDTIDECTIDIITKNASAADRLSEILGKDSSFCYAHILSLFETLRYSTEYVSSSDVREKLHVLEKQLSDGNLSSREALLAAAALAWYEGNHLKSGILLETSLLNHPFDHVAIGLAQDAYMTAGSAYNALGCLIRHPSPANSMPHLQGYLLGMLAAGHVETGSYEMAEEVGNRAVSMTRGQSAWAVHALANSYQLTGRSSDLLAQIDEYESTHTESTVGLTYLLLNKGCGQIMRGNYSGAFRVLEQLLEYFPDDGSYVNSAVYTNAVFLLWKLSLAEEGNEWQKYGPIWLYLARLGSTADASPVLNLCKVVALSYGAATATATATASSSDTPLADPDPDTDMPRSLDDAEEMPPSKPSSSPPSWWRRVVHATGMHDEHATGTDTTGTDTTGTDTTTGTTSNSSHGNSNSSGNSSRRNGVPNGSHPLLRSHIEEEYGDASQGFKPDTCKRALKSLCKKLQAAATTTSPSINTTATAELFPALRSVRPCGNISTVATSGIHSSVMSVSQDSVLLAFARALDAFHAGAHAEATRQFLQIQSTVHYTTGGSTAVCGDIARQMAMESALRDGDSGQLAQLLLTERSVLVPNDGQCWRNLAQVHARSGQLDLAQEAHYTAWQLGIGQGGFGGPR